MARFLLWPPDPARAIGISPRCGSATTTCCPSAATTRAGFGTPAG